MKILAYDVSGKVSSIALKTERGGLTFFQDNLHSSDPTIFLLPKIEELLMKGEVSFQHLDVIVTFSGPGSFTGIRAGLSALVGFSVALKKTRVLSITKDKILRFVCHDPDRPVVCDNFNQQFYLLQGDTVQIVSKDDLLNIPSFITDCPQLNDGKNDFIDPETLIMGLLAFVESLPESELDRLGSQPIEAHYFKTPVYKKYMPIV